MNRQPQYFGNGNSRRRRKWGAQEEESTKPLRAGEANHFMPQKPQEVSRIKDAKCLQKQKCRVGLKAGQVITSLCKG